MKTGIKDMMEKVAKPTRDQLEANIKVSHNWITAVSSGTFNGAACLHIATLLDFLQQQNKLAVKDFEAMYPPAATPEWTKPEVAQAIAHE